MTAEIARACLPLLMALGFSVIAAVWLMRQSFSPASGGCQPPDGVPAVSTVGRSLASVYAQSQQREAISRLTPAARRGTVLELHRDVRGGVQSLAFVMTFPLLLMLILFIVQLSQLLIGVVTVHYAAFAAARAASVWIPAATEDFTGSSGRSTNANILPSGVFPGTDWPLNSTLVDSLGSRKAREIWSAAALACVSISPSREMSSTNASSLAASAASALTAVTRAMDAGAAANGRLPARLASKTGYSFANTTVDVRFADRSNNSSAGQTQTYNPVGHPSVSYVGSEVGWQDPVAVTVRHRFALLPGPGRWLAAGIANGDGRIVNANGVYQTTLSATATMTVEGLQSLRPHRHAP